MDIKGVGWLLGFSFFLACSQVVIKLASGGLQPVFMASLKILCVGRTWCLDVVAKHHFVAQAL